jgi:hypothetical protein
LIFRISHLVEDMGLDKLLQNGTSLALTVVRALEYSAGM